MILRASKLLARVLVLLVALAALALGLFAWLLMRGPVSVAWLTPHLERELSSAAASVAIDRTELRLGRDQSLDLSAVGVRVRDAGGRLLGQLPEVEIGLSTSALLFERRIAVRRIDAVAPTLTLTRREDGTIGFAPQQTAGQSDPERFDVGALLIDFLTRSEPAEASADLEHVRFSGGKLILDDRVLGRTFTARDALLNLTVLSERATAELGFSIDQATRAASLHLTASHAPGQDWISIEVAFEHLLPAEFADLAPQLPLSGIQLALSGNAQSAVSLKRELAPILFDVAADPGVVGLPRLGIDELPIEAFWMQGSVAADLQGVTLDELRLSSDGAHITGRGEMAWRGGAPTLQADLEAENATIAHVERFWPRGEGQEARTWVIEHITDGVVPSARAKLRFGPGELGLKPLPEHALSGEFAFQNLTLRYVDTMPPLGGVDGNATFTGQRMDFRVTGGHVDDLTVEQGTVVITGIGIKGRDTTQLEIATSIKGPLQQALSLIDHPPLGFASRIGLVPDAASGEVVTDLRLGMPLHKDMAPSEVRVAADATITDAALAGPSLDLSDGQLTLSIEEQRAELAGQAVIQGVPVKLDVRETLGESAGVGRSYRLEASPDAEQLKQLGVDLPINLQGQVGVTATVTETAAGRSADVALDLTPTAIQVPQLNWRKAAGEPGTLTATATIPPTDGLLQVAKFALTSHDLHAEGSLDAQLEPFRLARLRVDQLRFGDTRAAVALHRGEAAGYEVRIDARTLDLTPWLDGAGPDQDRGAGGAEWQAPGQLDLRADQLILHGQSLHDVAANLVRGTDGWRSADLSGRLPEGGEFALSLAPDGAKQRLRLTSTDAGNLLKTLDQTSQIEGGELELEAAIFRQRPSLHAEGKLVARKFHVLDAPLLARLLTVASLTGIVNLLGGEGIAFERLDAPFVVRNQVLQLDKGRVYGSQLGLTFQGRIDLAADLLDLDGTIVPLYGLNWTIGQIPIIGQLLRGSEGEGAFAMTYGMSGPAGEPTIRVNPLSALAPGFLRELFTGLREGTLEPPEMLPSHDD